VADHVAAVDAMADRDGGLDRLIGGPGVAVDDDHHAATCENPGEGHRAGQRGTHRLSGGAEQVDAAVAGAPGGVRWVEAGDHLGRRPERPDPDGRRIGSGLGRKDDHESHQHGWSKEGGQSSAQGAHLRILRRCEGVGRTRR